MFMYGYGPNEPGTLAIEVKNNKKTLLPPSN